MKIVIFEEVDSNNFYPVSLSRPLWEIRSGCFTQRERFEIFFKQNGFDQEDIYYLTRDYLAPFYKERFPELNINNFSFLDEDDDILFVGSCIFPDKNILSIKKNELIASDDTPLLALIGTGSLNKEFNDPKKILSHAEMLVKQEANTINRIEFIWDLVKGNGRRIQNDFNLFNKGKKPSISDSVTIIGNSENLYIEDGVRIDPFVCIDLSEGPVIIKNGTVVNSFTRLEGPCYIGSNCLILGAKIREGCSFGDHCRVGGEVEESIFHGYSNKYHDGFIGHSYIGEWVNLGAMTTNSDLKNDYTNIKVYIPKRRHSTNSIKVGSFIGDFVKTSIGTLITTGSSIGTGSMTVHAGNFVPFHVPPFTWFIENRIISVSFFGDFIESCKAMTSRRDVEFTENYKELLIKILELTKDIREKELLKWKRIQK